MLERAGDWCELLSEGLSIKEAEKFCRHERSGCPMGSEPFISRLEALLGRVLYAQKHGPKGQAPNP